MTDKEYADFVKFASAKEFDPHTETQIEMEEVIKAVKYYFQRGSAESALRNDIQLKTSLESWK